MGLKIIVTMYSIVCLIMSTPVVVRFCALLKDGQKVVLTVVNSSMFMFMSLISGLKLYFT